jgi:CDP-2,3-bis-(O-geranylgeranyl)-sn-glycerol synthase
MGDTIISTLYLFLPAYAANMAPVLAKWLNFFPGLAVPIDGDREGENGFLGRNKTYRGLIAGLFAGVVVAEIQFLLGDHGFFRDISLFSLQADNAIVWGLLLGAGVLIGDLAKSFVKRKIGIKPGERWIPWDQLDMVIGGIIFGSLMYHFSWSNILILLIISPILIVAVNIFSYAVKIKENW